MSNANKPASLTPSGTAPDAETTGGLEAQCALALTPRVYAFAAVKVALHVRGSLHLTEDAFLSELDKLFELLEVANNHKR